MEVHRREVHPQSELTEELPAFPDSTDTTHEMIWCKGRARGHTLGAEGTGLPGETDIIYNIFTRRRTECQTFFDTWSRRAAQVNIYPIRYLNGNTSLLSNYPPTPVRNASVINIIYSQ